MARNLSLMSWSEDQPVHGLLAGGCAVPFIEEHGLWTAEQEAAADEVERRVKELELRQVRIAWGDQHGILRGKNLEVGHFLSVLRRSKDFQTATLIFDTTNNPVVPPFEAGALGDPRMTGLPDGVLVPDPRTFKVLPWLDRTGWVLSDLYYQSGERVPFDTRGILQEQVGNWPLTGTSSSPASSSSSTWHASTTRSSPGRTPAIRRSRRRSARLPTGSGT
ncbi:hypothetical protein ACFYZ5_46470 [Streptomyces chartreusis]|uniref:hypothetical protein n=1 Tax=Streptomyces chartreusis TaxID=1969 RepID=UPI0036C5AE06